DALLAAELIAARVEHHEKPLRRVEMLDTPCLRRQHLPLSDVVIDQFPVRDDHSVESEFVTKESPDHLPVVTKSDLLDRPSVTLEADRHPVIRHHPRSAGGDRRAERFEVDIEGA